MTFATAAQFVADHMSAIVLILMAIAGIFGWTGYIDAFRHSKLIDIALEGAFSTVNRLVHENPQLVPDKLGKGIELFESFYEKLKIAPPANYKVIAETMFTAWHDQQTIDGSAPATTPK